jgi:hypothetical protein
MIVGCSDAAPPDTPAIERKDEIKELTAHEVLVGLASDRDGAFCAIGKTNSGEQFQLWTAAHDAEPRTSGRIQVAVRVGNTVTSEFYNEAEMAIKAVTDRGVVKYYKCLALLDM